MGEIRAVDASRVVPRSARMSRVDRRDHLLDVAVRIVRAHGVGAVTMERIAEIAGVSKGLGYAYFDNSGAVLKAVRVRETTRLISGPRQGSRCHLRPAVTP